MTSFVLALLQIAQEEGSTVTLEEMRNAALAKLAAGELKSLVSSTVNGKSFSFQINKPADILFQEASQAIKLYNQGVVTATEVDFSCI